MVWDHSTLLLDTLGDARVGPKPFWFEGFWIKDPGCKVVVKAAWGRQFLGSPAAKKCALLAMR